MCKSSIMSTVEVIKLYDMQLKEFFLYNVKVKEGRVHSIAGNEGPEGEYRYSSTLSLT